ncbi:hypothetical protein PPTG_20845 [Phytophthora nicotianae INRA-310]|uniref:Uncharacterized protein n=1 Tax=Phytophthora nicotianae (strain INRA-310) TaxID=761204 RepID=W2RHN1_PHYN3|nr:hypothetical protein PPTG_20845 [Phytophthora nicotianae INRA-310]ETN24923.1 hypothetical protein PPTG_20845 [Phytophthora nicotianae INRA-310]
METERRRRHDELSSVPITVREAIQAVPDAGTNVLFARPNESSFVETCRTQRAKMLMSGGRRRKRLSTSARRMVLTLTRLPANWARNELVKKNSPYYDGAHCIEMIPAVRTS